MISRNQIFVALLALARSISWEYAGSGPQAFQSLSRRIKAMSDYEAGETPALIQVEPSENITSRANMPNKRIFEARWVIYFQSDAADQTFEGAALANNIMDSIEAVIGPVDAMTRQTLGGLVERVYIDGEVIKVTGDDSGDGVLVVPLKIVGP